MLAVNPAGRQEYRKEKAVYNVLRRLEKIFYPPPLHNKIESIILTSSKLSMDFTTQFPIVKQENVDLQKP